MTYTVYILRCVDESLYTGMTTDVARRFAEHRAGKGGSYTSSHLPQSIVYTERCKTRGIALRREAAIKRLSRKEKLALLRA